MVSLSLSVKRFAAEEMSGATGGAADSSKAVNPLPMPNNRSGQGSEVMPRRLRTVMDHQSVSKTNLGEKISRRGGLKF